MNWHKGQILCLSVLMFLLSACKDSNSDPVKNFDRSALLSFWADDMIIPAFEDLDVSLQSLLESNEVFVNQPTVSTLEKLQGKFIESYLLWQQVSIFDIGFAEEISYRQNMNIYPCDTALIEANILKSELNLELPSNFSAQGFPAMDYMLFGHGESAESNLHWLNSDLHLQHVSQLLERMAGLTQSILSNWKVAYRESFIANDGSSATAATDKVVNDFLFYYEKFLRAGKIGIPAGVFSTQAKPDKVEGFYAKKYSRLFCKEAIRFSQDFFNGKSLKTDNSGISLRQYLNSIGDEAAPTSLVKNIDNHFEEALTLIEALPDDFSMQIETDPQPLLQLYDVLQKGVILMKVDMLQALNIQVDYVDADGD